MIRHLIAAIGTAASLYTPMIDPGQPLVAMNASVTEYCETGYTADGAWTYVGEAAASYGIPFGSVLHVPGIGNVIVEDRGRLGRAGVDVYNPSCWGAIQWGRRQEAVTIVRRGWKNDD